MDSKVLNLISRITNRCVVSSAQSENLKLLEDPKTKLVVTGQQVGLFGGPLLTLYKALGCVLYANEVRRREKIACVPVFWLQTEDHDFAEVATTHFIAIGGAVATVSAQDGSASAARVSLHYRTLGPDINAVIESVQAALGGAPNGAWLCELLSDTYRPGQSWEGAFHSLLHALLKDTGLLFFHARDQVVAELCAPIYRRAIECHQDITTLLQATIEQDKVVEQVHIRAGSPLAFFHTFSANSERVRLQARADEFDFIGTSGSIANKDLIALTNSDPLRFSASALLRPIVQQALLQPLQYVGGAAELAYFRQITKLFDFFELDRPTVVTRPSARILDHKFRGWLSEYGFSLQELTLGEDQFVRLLASKSGFANPESIRSQVYQKLSDLFKMLEDTYLPIDVTLRGSIERTRGKISPSFEGLHERFLKALAAKDQVRNDRLQRIRTHVMPAGIEQERYFSALSFLARYGLEFVDLVKAHLKLFTTEPVTIELE